MLKRRRYASLHCVLCAGCHRRPVGQGRRRLIESTEAREDIAPSKDPGIAFWRAARPVYAEKGPQGRNLVSHRTEVRSRRTKKNLYFLSSVLNDKLNLKPSPSISTETFRLWDWIVAEVFIGADFQTSGDTRNSKSLRRESRSIPTSTWHPPTTKMVGFGTLVLRWPLVSIGRGKRGMARCAYHSLP